MIRLHDLHSNVYNIGCSAPLPANCYCIFSPPVPHWINEYGSTKWRELRCVVEHKGMSGRLSVQNPVLSFTYLIWASCDHCIIQQSSTSWSFKYCNRTLYSIYRIYFSFSAVSKYYNSHFNPFGTSKWMCKIKLQGQATFRHSSWPLRVNGRARAFPKHSALWHTVPSLTSIFTGDPMIIVFSWMFSLNSGEWSLTSSTVINTSAKLYFPSVSSAFT